MNFLKKGSCLELVKENGISNDAKLVKAKLILNRKRKPDGNLIKNKVQMYVHGGLQT